MELSKEQLLQIDKYILACGIQFYDVRTEILDHFANILEQKLDENPKLDFKKEIEKIHKNFSDWGFSKFLEEKTKSVKKRFYKQSLKHFFTFFKFPKVILSLALFYMLFLVMNLFEDKETFFQIITGVGFVVILGVFFNLFIEKKKKKKEVFLALNLNYNFILFLNNSCIFFNSITTFRTKESFLSPIYNGMQLSVFALIILMFWSGMYIKQQNKKLVQKQYSNVLV